MSDRDRILMRLKDIVLLIGALGGLLAALGKIFVLANAVEGHGVRLDSLEPRVSILQTQVAIEEERWTQIQSQLTAINRKLDKRFE